MEPLDLTDPFSPMNPIWQESAVDDFIGYNEPQTAAVSAGGAIRAATNHSAKECHDRGACCEYAETAAPTAGKVQQPNGDAMFGILGLLLLLFGFACLVVRKHRSR